MSRWRVARPCADCPFNDAGPGLGLRRSLRPGRWREILAQLRRDGHFLCHRTTSETGDGTNRVCAGSIAWQDARGLPSQYRRICERLDAAAASASPSTRSSRAASRRAAAG